MLDKIKLKLTIMNTIVVLTILMCIAIFVYVMVLVDSNNNADNELINNAYLLKRYITLFDGTASDAAIAEYSDEYIVFKEKLLNSSVSYGVWDSNSNEYEYVSAYNLPYDSLSKIRYSMFTTDPQSSKVIEESDGKYFIHRYSYNDVNIRVCTTVFANDSGQMRIIQTVQNMNAQENMADKLLKVLLLAMLIGASLSFISGYFIAGRSIVPIQENLNRQKDFVADASHELRTPVTIMKTNLDAVKCFPDESIKSQMEWIDNAYKETEYMQQLIDKMLIIAKADIGSPDEHYETVDIRKICRSMRSRFKDLAAEKGIKISVYDKAKNEKMLVSGDEAQLKLLFSNIIDNSIHYSPNNKSVKIILSTLQASVKVDIQDNGIGISKEDLKNIFDRFYRADKARSRREGGSGLGLPIAMQIAKEHHGNITATSQPGEGTIMSVTLPRINEE